MVKRPIFLEKMVLNYRLFEVCFIFINTILLKLFLVLTTKSSHR